MSKFNVLVFPGGTEIGLEINRALRDCKDVTLYSAGLAISNHAPFVYKNHFEIPPIHQDGWLESLNLLLEKYNIDFIFPAYDDIIVALASRSGELKARVITSPLETCLIARSKLQTYKFFKNILPVPILHTQLEKIDTYPIFVKPDIGQGSQGAEIIRSYDQLRLLVSEADFLDKDLIISEYLPGAEFTVDCFSHRNQGLLYCAGRERIRTKSGISMSSRHISNPVFVEYAKTISKHLIFYGAWFFQLKQDASGEYKLLEMAPRIAGTMALSRVKGVNFPLLSLYESLEMPLQVVTNDIEVEIDRALTNRYKHSLTFDVLYLDLDDTVIVNNSLNLEAIRLIYQCVNKDIRVVLLTRHHADLDQTLKRFRLSTLFDEIIHIRDGQEKVEYIKEEKAIFVDDSFRERQLVKERFHIPTFDSSMIEMLLDDRV